MVREVLAFVRQELEALRQESLLVTIRTLESPQGAWIVVDGRKVLNLCSNNYLGFCNDPALKDAAKRAIDEFGVGPGAVRTIAGTLRLHVELERKLAQFKGAEEVVAFQSGFCANLATIPALVGREMASSPTNSTMPPSLTVAVFRGQKLSAMPTAMWKTCGRNCESTAIASAMPSSSPMACSAWMATSLPFPTS